MICPVHLEYQMFKGQRQAAPTSITGARKPTTPDIEGPFYKAGAPIRSVICEGKPTLTLIGTVSDVDGNSVPGALLDFWQADESGNYDLDGYKLRGKILAVSEGSYHFSLGTIRPGDYKIANDPSDFRCAHIHVKVTADGFKPLTTQLYFSDDPYNATDHWFDADRVIESFRTPGSFFFAFVLAKKD